MASPCAVALASLSSSTPNTPSRVSTAARNAALCSPMPPVKAMDDDVEREQAILVAVLGAIEDGPEVVDAGEAEQAA